MTAVEMAVVLGPYGLALTADGYGIEYDDDCPPSLDARAAVLASGVAAVLLGRDWWGCFGATGCGEVLSPDALVPHGVTLLTVAGWPVWDRVPPCARNDLADLFASPKPPPARKARRPKTVAHRPAGADTLSITTEGFAWLP